MKFLPFAFGLLCAAPAFAQDNVFDCVMDPSQLVKVASPTAGILGEVLVSRGQRVGKGDVIAKLVSETEIQSLELLELRANSTAAIDAQTARRDLLQSRFNRQEQLLLKNIASNDSMNEITAELSESDSLLRQAELEKRMAGLEFERAKQIVDQRNIKSPIDGLVLFKRLSAGEFLASDSFVASIVSLDPLYIEAFLPIAFYASLQVGQTAVVTPNAPLDGRYEAQITVIDQIFDAASGTFGVRLELPNPDGLLPAGQRCELTISGS
jgi:RND family efflux transporter MFP subunit